MTASPPFGYNDAVQDVQEFEQKFQADPAVHAFLREGGTGGQVTITRAPGRLDVMGGVVDYSGGLVAEMTIAEAALAALSPRADKNLRLWSLGIETDGLTPQVTLSLDDFYDSTRLRDYAAVHALLTQESGTRWAAYLAGCFYTLLAEKVVPEFPRGANLVLDSRVPLGAGVSSSAAIEVATMQAINVAYGLGLDGVAVAKLAQTVENRVVGAPCGIMDQMTSALGEEESLFLLLCRPHEVQGTQPLPPDVRVWGINSNVKHSVGGTAYTRARVAAFMGRKLLDVDYLTNFAAPRSSKELALLVPTEEVSGANFLAETGETGDPVTRIDATTIYPVGAAIVHAVMEHDRVQHFVHLMTAGNDNATLTRAGQLMYEAHASYTRIGLGCEETDLLVMLGREAGPTKGIYGAKITGGGSGGTVAFLTDGVAADEAIREIAAEYQEKTGLTPQIMVGGQSPGAMAFGHHTVSL